MKLSNKSLITIFEQLYFDLNNKSDGFWDYVDEDYTVEQLLEECNNEVTALNEVKQELLERGILTDEFDTTFDFNEYLTE